jgi:hypothetical protein
MEITSIIPYQKALLCESIEPKVKDTGRILISSGKDSVNLMNFKILAHGRALSEEDKALYPVGANILSKRVDNSNITLSVKGKVQTIVYIRDVLAIQE